MNRVLIVIYFLLGVIVLPTVVSGQEVVGPRELVAPINYNSVLKNAQRVKPHRSPKKALSNPLTLPFFESFTGYWIFPDSNKWVDAEVYINNTMCVSPIDRGCATFDDLNSIGVPYDSFDNSTVNYADSLTSQPINLSSYGPGDSLYLSFFFQPQGHGFYPLPGDSLMLFFIDKYGGAVKQWSIDGIAGVQPFQEVMIPITDSIYFDSFFQFRFVNMASLDWSDAVWNVDYIRLAANRSAGDSTVPDAAFSTNPTFLLNDYSYMPYRQFMANPLGEMAAHVYDTVQNDTSYPQPAINTTMIITDQATGNVLKTGNYSCFPLGYQNEQVTLASSIPTVNLPAYPDYTRVDFGIQYYFQSTPSTGITANDTIVKEQIFDNYLAYDDGTAEKSYYLNLSPTEEGRIAIEFHLNTPDTMQGMAIYFGRQIPYPVYKTFDIFVWSALDSINGATADIALDSDEALIPYYNDTENNFWYYRFTTPLLLPAGTFYAGTRQICCASDDSIYFGLDVNRIGSNHAYYNVNNVWVPSEISGAIMMRPILGQYIVGTGINQVNPVQQQWKVMPNPAKDELQFEFEGNSDADYIVTNIQGIIVLQGNIYSGKTINISGLIPGLYFVNLINGGVSGTPQKIIKL